MHYSLQLMGFKLVRRLLLLLSTLAALLVLAYDANAYDTELLISLSTQHYNMGDKIFITPALHYHSGSADTFSPSIKISGLAPFDIDNSYAYPLPNTCTTSSNYITCAANSMGTEYSFGINATLVAEVPGEHTITITSSPVGEDTTNNSVTLTVFVNAQAKVTILSPLDETTVAKDIGVELHALADDPEDGDLSQVVEWVSNVDGPLGQSGSTVMLTPGRHTLRAYATDSNEITSYAETHIVLQEVQSNTPVIKTIAGSSESGYVDEENPLDARFGGLGGVAQTPSGEIYLLDNSNEAIRKIAVDGSVTTVLSGQMFTKNSHLMADNAGNVYWQNNNADAVYRLTPDGSVAKFAGGGYFSPTDGMPATDADISTLGDLVSSPHGNIYLSSYYDHKVFKIDEQGCLQSIAGNGENNLYPEYGGLASEQPISYPESMAVDSLCNVYIAQNTSLGARIFRVSPEGVLSLYAGMGDRDWNSNFHPALEANLDFVHSLMVNDQDELLMFDSSYMVRKIDKNGILIPVYGNGAKEDSGDGGFAAEAGIYGGHKLLTVKGELLLTQGYRVRLITNAEQQSDFAIAVNAANTFNQGTPATAQLQINNLYNEIREIAIVDITSTDTITPLAESCKSLGADTIRCVLHTLPAGESIVVPVQLNNKSAGAYQLVATIYDYFQELKPADNEDVFNYDVNALPVVTILSPNDGQDFVSIDTITFEAAANDSEDGDLSAQVSWVSSVDGPLAKGNMITAQLSKGNHIITATAVDSVGASASEQISVLVEEYNSAPNANIISPANGSTLSEDDGPISFVAEISDAESTLAELDVQWSSSLDGVIDGESATLSPGEHIISLDVTDPSGLSAGDTIQLTITPHVNVAPEIVFSTPQNNSSFSVDDGPIVFVIEVFDQENSDTVSVSLSSSLDGGITSPAVLSIGTHVITAVATDEKGLASSAEITLTILPHVNAVPVVTFNSPENGSTVHNKNSITFSVSASDAEDGDLSDSVQLTSSIDGIITLPALLSVGEHTIVASVADSDGATAEASISLIVIEYVNSEPTVQIMSPDDGSEFTENDNPISFTIVAMDDDDGDLSGSIVLESSLDGIISSTATLTVGNHKITAQVADSEGLTATDTVSITVKQESATPNYCSASGTSQSFEWIEAVSFDGTNVNSGCGTGYTDNSEIVFSVNAGDSVAVSLTPGFSGSSYSEHWEIWIDSSNDGTFDNSELVFSAASSTTLSGLVAIPEGIEGSFRMRVIMYYGSSGPTNGCGSFTYGEVEDYTVEVAEGAS